MKIRESGMPDEEYWNSFFDVEFILDQLQLNNKINNAAEFGSGYGTFSIPAAEKIKGILYAIDIDEKMIENLNRKISSSGKKNIKTIIRDFVDKGSGLGNNSVEYVMLFNILHAEKPLVLLNEAKRILRPGGKVGIIHWLYSLETPRGPSLNIRPTEDQITGWLKISGLEILKGAFSLPPYHYGLIAGKLKLN